MKTKLLFGFHAVAARIRHDASTIEEIYVDASRHDRRMGDLLRSAKSANVRIIQADDQRLDAMVGTRRHQGVVARAGEISLARNLSELIDGIQGPPLLLLLDGVTDPHNLGACLRVADGAGAHAVIAPKDRAVGLNATAARPNTARVAWMHTPCLKNSVALSLVAQRACSRARTIWPWAYANRCWQRRSAVPSLICSRNTAAG